MVGSRFFSVDISGRSFILPTDAAVSAGEGSPEGVVQAVPGSLFLRLDGGPAESVYVKTTGVQTSTGWVAIAAGGAGLTVGAKAHHSVNQVFGAGLGGVPLSWDGENYDTGAIHDVAVNNDRLTVPAGRGGLWAVGYMANVTAVTGAFDIAIRRNASNAAIVARATTPASLAQLIVCATVDNVVAGDFWDAAVFTIPVTGGGTVVCNGTGQNSNFWATGPL